MPSVLNKRNGSIPKGAIYVGRPSKWGNPFKIGKDGTREEVIQKYRSRIFNILQSADSHYLDELKGKDLVCWCSPLPCHADILLELANQEEEKRKTTQNKK